MGVRIRSLVYLAFMSLSILAFSVPLGVMGWLLPYAWLARVGRAWGRLNIAALGAICGLRYRVTGLNTLPKETCVVLCKHQSTWETIALRALLPPEHTWVLKRELLWVPFFGWGIAPFRPIAVDRKAGRKAVRKLLEEGTRWLEKGRWVVVFPEGTRVPAGKRGKYGIGGALLAEKAGYPVLPIAHNAGVFWPRRSIDKQPGTIELVIGEPIRIEGRSAAEVNRMAEAWIEATVERLPQSPQ